MTYSIYLFNQRKVRLYHLYPAFVSTREIQTSVEVDTDANPRLGSDSEH